MSSLFRKHWLRISFFNLALFAGASAIHAQSALDGFDPNANGAIRAIVVQADGKILIGGEFTTLAPNGGVTVTRNHIARLNSDGTLDNAFDPNANGGVYAIAVQSDGKIVVGGNFSGANSVGGQTRNFIARLNATTGAADSFDPNASLPVFAVAVQSNGKIVVGGLFNGLNSIGGQTRNYIARLDAVTGAADSFDPNANSYVSALLIQADDKIVVAGDFSGVNSIGGQMRNRIARLDPATGLADSFDPNANSTVLSLAQEADGKIIAGGDFSGPNSIGGQTRNFIARLDSLTGAADSFDPNASSVVLTVAVQPDGRILAGGSFATIGGQTRNHMARLSPTSGLADSFDPNLSSTVFAIAVQADNKALIGGDFITASPLGGASVSRNHVARLERDGRLDRTLNLNLPMDSGVTAIAVQPDGKILLGGRFSTVLGVSRNSIARLNSDGTLDTVFNPNANAPLGSTPVYSIALQPDGKILLGGDFTTIGGQTRNRIARLNAVTGVADSFDPNANGRVALITVQPDGKILVGGGFTSIGGQTRNRIARLDAVTGGVDSFDPNADSQIEGLAVQADGKVLVGGFFTSIGGQTRNRIARLDAVTGAADSFNPNSNDQVHAIAVKPDGKILVAGWFSNIGGQMHLYITRLVAATGGSDGFNPNSNGLVYSMALQADDKVLVGGSFNGTASNPSIGGQLRNRIARLLASGLADSFDPNANNPPINTAVTGIAMQADSKVLVGGGFNGANSIGGQTRNYFARLTNDTAALQNLAVTQNAVTWTLGGSSPQFARVSFEFSTDNVNYTALGDGTAAGSNWSLTGLSLPAGQNIYVRARGYYHGGYFNGSESIAESVRNAFITIPTPMAVVSRKMHGDAGTFDINLPLTDDAGIECRSGGASNDYQIVFSFPSSVTFTNASVTAGTGSVSGSSGSGTSTVIVNLTGVTNAQRLTVTLLGVNDGTGTTDLSVQMGVLLGDTSGNGTVNASDVSQTKSKSGQSVDAANFRTDVTVNGSINASDVSLVKSNSGTALP